MQGPPGERLWMGATVSLGFGLALTWGLLNFGAAQTSVAYLLFLALLVPSLLALATPPLRERVDLRFFVLVLVGLFLLGQVALQPTLEARGYLHLAVGWIALWLGLWLAAVSRGQPRFLLVVLVLLGVLEAFYGLVQSVGGYDFIGDYFRNRGRIATGTLINRNHFAALLNMLLPLALGMLYAHQALERSQRASRSESLAKTWIALLGCSSMGVAVLLSQSRGGTLSLVMTLLFLGMLLHLGRRRRSRRGLSGASAAVLLFLVVGMATAFGLEALFERFGRISEDLSRVEVFQETLEMIGDSPIIGVGPGMFRWRFRLYQSTRPSVFYDHAHNDYLETAAEWGVPLAVLLWGLAFWRLFRSSVLALTDDGPYRRGLALGTAGALLSILVHSLVDFSLQIPAVLLVFGSILALSWSLDFRVRSPTMKRPASVPAIPPAAAGVGIVLRVMLIAALLGAGYQTWTRMRAERAGAPEAGVPGLERAVELDPTVPEPRFLLGMAYRDLPGVGNPIAAIECLERAVRLNPYAWRYWMELSRAQELRGDLDQAEASLLVAINLNPSSGEYRWRLANLLLRRGAADEALEEIAAAIDLEPHLAEPAAVLLTKFGVSGAEISDLLPQDRATLLRVLATLMRRLEISEGVLVSAAAATLIDDLWKRLLTDPDPPAVSEGRGYVDHLVRSHQYRRAQRAWIELTQLNGTADDAFEEGRNHVWNGDFERELLGAPLGWRIIRSESFSIARIPSAGTDGSTALMIEFSGSENVSFAHVAQLIVLESGSDYRFSAALRSQDLTTDQGVYIEIVTPSPERLLMSSEPVLGSSDWTLVESEFLMPEDSHVAEIRLRRQPSQQIDNRLRGKVYIDSVRIEDARP